MAYESGYSDSISMPKIHKTGTGAGERRLALYVEGNGNINEKVDYFSDISSYIIAKKDLEVYLRMSYEEYHHRTRKSHQNIDYHALYEDNIRLIQGLDKKILQLHYEASTRNGDSQVYLNLVSDDLVLFKKYLWPILIPNQQSPNIKFTKFTLNKIRLFNSNYIYMKPEFKKEYSENELVEVLKRYLSEDNKSKDVTLHKFIVRMCNFIKDDDELMHICERLGLNEYEEDARRCFYVCKELIKEKVDLDLSELELPHEPSFPIKNNSPIQQIFYGAPGTGKSYRIKEQLINVPKENIFRTTFHPDSDYSTFVGAYKPTMKKQYRYDGKVKAKYYEDDDLAEAKKDDVIIDKVIQYNFVPQTFLKAYIRAYQTNDNVYLLIEEINRGNCAQIFGDLFQLLDRDENGISEYTIKADADLRAYLEDSLGKDSKGIKDGELCLPSNLYIYATMNTSDQSLFPIDSAFKRRWDWEYEPIKYKNIDWVIEINGINYSWTSFQKEVNTRIFDVTNSEDKMLGDYFIKPYNRVISKELLLNKVLFYLWNDVCKDGDDDIFKTEDNKDVKFSDLYGDNGTEILLSMMRHLKVSINEEKENNGTLESGNSDSQYSINNGPSFRKTHLAKEVFNAYVNKYQNLSAEEVLTNWRNKMNEWKDKGISIPLHLIENSEWYSDYINSSVDDDARKKNESRFEPYTYKEVTFYLWKGWGDGAHENISAFMEAINNQSDWGIKISRINATLH